MPRELIGDRTGTRSAPHDEVTPLEGRVSCTYWRHRRLEQVVIAGRAVTPLKRALPKPC